MTYTLTSLLEVTVQSDTRGKAAAPHTVTMTAAIRCAVILSTFSPPPIPGASRLSVKGFIFYCSSSSTLPLLLYESLLLLAVSSDAQTSKPDGFFMPTLIMF